VVVANIRSSEVPPGINEFDAEWKDPEMMIFLRVAMESRHNVVSCRMTFAVINI
jgi:hypothetical protein